MSCKKTLMLDSGKELIVRLDNPIFADRQDRMLSESRQVAFAKQSQAINRTSNDKGLTFVNEAKGFDALDFPATLVIRAILGAGGGGGGGHGQRIGWERAKRNIFFLLFEKFFFRKVLTRV